MREPLRPSLWFGFDSDIWIHERGFAVHMPIHAIARSKDRNTSMLNMDTVLPRPGDCPPKRKATCTCTCKWVYMALEQVGNCLSCPMPDPGQRLGPTIHMVLLYLSTSRTTYILKNYPLIDSCIIQLKAQGPSRTCNESEGASRS